MKYYPNLDVRFDRDMRDSTRDMQKYISKKKLRAKARVNSIIAKVQRESRKAKPLSGFGSVEDSYYAPMHVPTREALLEMGMLSGINDTWTKMPLYCKVAAVAILAAVLCPWVRSKLS